MREVGSQTTSLEKSFARAVAIMAQLRAPGGCPWDREQTFDSIRRYTLEETYEVLDAIERKDWSGLKDELGDLLLQVLFYAEMAQEEKLFTLAGCDRQSERKIDSSPSACICKSRGSGNLGASDSKLGRDQEI